jgi:hypothetical protein
MAADAAGLGRMLTSHADRDQVIDALKTAFVNGRLTRDELDERTGRALAVRTCADLGREILSRAAAAQAGTVWAGPGSPAARPSRP